MKRRLLTSWPAFFIFIFFVFGRIFSYFKSSVPLGYDPGLYLYLFKKFSQNPLPSFTSLSQLMIDMNEPGIAIIGKTLAFFFSPEKILLPLIVFFEILLFVSIYLLVKKLWGKRSALWAVFIYTCSAIQYRFYWYYYLKNITALAFLLSTFYFLLSSSYWAVLFSILVVYFHRQTGMILLATLLASLIFQKKQRKFLSIIFISTLLGAAVYYVPMSKITIFPIIQPIVKSFIPKSLGGQMGASSGTFYNVRESFLLSLPYLFFSLWGLWLAKSQRKNLLVIIPLLVSFVVTLLGAYGARRFIPFIDLFLIILGGFGLSELKIKKTFQFLYCAFMLLFISIYILKSAKPLIFEDELKEISMLRETEPEAYVLVTDQNYMPWVYGWSDRKPITPGYGEYDIFWTIPEWHKFWISNDRKVEHDLLLKLPKPLYIYHGDMGSRVPTDFSGKCFERINWRTYKFICNK